MKELFVLAMMVASGFVVQIVCSQFFDEPDRVYREAAEDAKWLEETYSVVAVTQPTN